jgi:hypothetical protein
MGNSRGIKMNDKIYKQTNLFGQEDKDETIYSKKIKSPTYEPSNQKPNIIEIVDTSKTMQLIREIQDSSLDKEEKEFLIEAARRHSVFNYEKIADYYAHSSPQMQYLMEKSALIIIDFEKAIQLGYVRLCEKIQEEYLELENE